MKKIDFKLKMKPAIDYPVMALEGLWWAPGGAQFTLAQLMSWRDAWQWTMMILQPDFITRALVKQALAELIEKRGESPALKKIRLGSLREGLCAQVLHVGPYAAEALNIERLHQSIIDGGHQLRGKHHEIYLGDPRRTKPEKLKTILRQPLK